MTPSQHIESVAESIWKDIGVASSRLCIALVRRRIGIATMQTVHEALLRAARRAKCLVEYMQDIKEK